MYPLKFHPVFQKRLWGGQRLRTILGKPLPAELQRAPVGESWELADLPPGTVQAGSAGANADGSLASKIANGPLAGKSLHDVWSKDNQESKIKNQKSHFPLLVKFLDAQQDLSVQVHPDAAYARTHPGAHLKSEAWYILHAEPGAKIYKGLKPGTTREQFKAALDAGAAADLLNAVPVRPGDCHYLESGTVHALGAGILAAEVQTPSDTTFRVFDWNRIGPDGKPRKLLIEQALACINFNAPPMAAIPRTHPELDSTRSRLVTCEHFTLDRIAFQRGNVLPLRPGIAAWIILDGQGVITADGYGPTAFARGDVLLLPATMKNAQLRIIAPASVLEARPLGCD